MSFPICIGKEEGKKENKSSGAPTIDHARLGHAVHDLRLGDMALVHQRRGLLGALLEQEVALDEVRQPDAELVRDVALGRDRKDLCKSC